LSADGETAAVAKSAVAVDGLESFEVGLDFAAEVTFDDKFVGLDGLSDGIDLGISEFVAAGCRINLGLFEEFDCP
jgi:hypothetical protein